MPVVFVDTVAWIALANTRDSLHSVAREIFDRLWESDTSFITTEFILVELGMLFLPVSFVCELRSLFKL